MTLSGGVPADLPAYVVLVVMVLFAHFVKGVTGFGGVVLALPVLALLFPLKVLIPALVVVNLLQSGWFAVSERRYVDVRAAASIVILAVLGLPLGYALFRYLPSGQLKIGLGIVVVSVALWNLLGLRLPWEIPRGWYRLLNLAGGFIHGALASGGPFLVIYAARMVPEKSAFRATLSVAWVVLNSVLCMSYTVSGVWDREVGVYIAIAFPCVALGTVLGIVAHDRIPQRPFETLVFVLLLVSGLTLFFK